MKEDDDTFERTCRSKGVVWRFGRGDTTGRSASLFSSHLLCGDGLLCHSYTDSLFVIAWRCWYVVIFPLCAAQNSTPFSLCDAVWCRWPEAIGSSVPLWSSSRYVLRTFVKNEIRAFSSKWFYIWVYAAPVGFTSDENHSNKFIVHDRWRITTLFLFVRLSAMSWNADLTLRSWSDRPLSSSWGVALPSAAVFLFSSETQW